MPRPLTQRISQLTITDLATARATLCLCDPDDPALTKHGGTVEFPVSDDLRRALEQAVADGITAAEAIRQQAEAEAQAQREADQARQQAREEDARNLTALAAERLRAEEAARPALELAEVEARSGFKPAEQVEELRARVARGRATPPAETTPLPEPEPEPETLPSPVAPARRRHR